MQATSTSQFESTSDGEVASKEIGEKIMAALFNLDQVAYVRFASVYQDFKEASDFRDFLGEMAEEKQADSQIKP